MSKLNYIEDKELLKRFYSDNNNEWLGELLPRYTVLLFGVCMKYLKNAEDAKDAVQQIFLKAINEMHKYKVEYFKSWIYMIAKNHCLMKLRNKGNHIVEITDQMMATPDTSENKYLIIEKENQLIQLQLALQDLNPEQRLCLTLFYLQKKAYSQVAKETGFKMMQVKSNIQNGKRNLRILLEKKLDQADS